MTNQILLINIVVLLITTVMSLLPSINGNVIDQRALQKELRERNPEIISLDDKMDYRDFDEPNVNDYVLKPKDDEQSLENALIKYLITRQIENLRARRTDMIRAQKKKSYWKQCAFNAVSCFG
ncbi:uncharacterized protein LOC126908383 [Daktulosphaira vitifoliae]|uniref:uncharacterized protein LOC126908383 n=1 Tax=Daktulosphaira vitifoliae TaxID=58002 RepID=UPI0021AA4CBD|nr:uncharacterized protein LOC126908383 [Daktulosphaira vitifoliae]